MNTRLTARTICLVYSETQTIENTEAQTQHTNTSQEMGFLHTISMNTWLNARTVCLVYNETPTIRSTEAKTAHRQLSRNGLCTTSTNTWLNASTICLVYNETPTVRSTEPGASKLNTSKIKNDLKWISTDDVARV